MEVRQDIYAKPDLNKPVQPHQQRVVQERLELKDRLDKLLAFIATNPQYTALDAQECKRMVRQSEVMKEYIAILDERVAAFSTVQP